MILLVVKCDTGEYVLDADAITLPMKSEYDDCKLVAELFGCVALDIVVVLQMIETLEVE
jgi:hypothetical protein